MVKTVKKTVIVPYSPEQMFNLVADVPAYSKFLPWCSHSALLQEYPDGVLASVTMRIKGLEKSFTTRNTYGVDPHHIHVKLVDGPFSALEGWWTFTKPTTDKHTENTCHIDFKLHYTFSSGLLTMVLSPVFDKIAHNLVDAFVTRARTLYG
jgi:ribosome-associated toxin RatA of RatAB toxin-antitoxin module